MDKNITGVYVYNGENIDFNYCTSLNTTDKIEFISLVTNTLVGNDYYSIIRDIIFDFAIISIFTDINTSYIDKSTNAIDMIEDLLNKTNIVEIVKENIDDNLIRELNKGVDDNIAYRTGIHKDIISESLSNLVNTIEKKVSDIDTKSMMEMAQIISGMSGELTVDKMLEAYSKSDMFKKNHKS